MKGKKADINRRRQWNNMGLEEQAIARRINKKAHNKKVTDEHIEYLCDLNNKDTSVPQDVDTKVALHDIEERGASAIGNVLDRAIPDEDSITDTEEFDRKSYDYDRIKWEDNKTKLRVKGWKFCPVCGNKVKKPRLNKGKDTCSKTCNDKTWNK